MNRVSLIGRITKQPELKFTPNGVATCSFSLAVERQFKDASGQKQTDFINCVAWRQQAEFIGNWIDKGYLLGITGSIQTRSYQTQNGATVYVTEVIVDQVENLTPRQEPKQQPQRPTQQAKPQPQRPAQPYVDPYINNDDIPF